MGARQGVVAPGTQEAAVTSREWGQVKRLFAKAKDIEESQQSAYLERACRNTRIRGEVKSLLAHRKTEGILGIYSSIGNKVLGHYEIQERIGEGGTAVVYRARDIRLERWVAIKALQPWAMGNPNSRERLTKEARSVSSLNHPNIVTIHEIAEENGFHFIVMEYIDGKTLNRCVPPGGLSIEKALHFAGQIVDALATAHSAGVVHGDIKPLNIMVTDRAHLKVLDFGLAQVLTAQPTQPESQRPADRFGTKVYMAPELLRDRSRAPDRHSEMFSVGLILHEALAGQHAFGTGTPEELVAAILHESPKSLSEVPASLADIVGRCLDKDPDRRFQSMHELSLALDGVVGSGRLGRAHYPAGPSAPLRLEPAPSAGVESVEAAVEGIRYQNLGQCRQSLSELAGLIKDGTPAVREAAASSLKELILSIDDFEGRVIPAPVRELRKRMLEVIKVSTQGDLRHCFAEQDLEFLDLYGIDFGRQALAGFSFKGCFLVEASFQQCDLSRTSFAGASLRNVDFDGATLSGADFTDADWFNAMGLTENQLASARQNTLLDCPRDMAAMQRFLSSHYVVPFESWSPRLQEQLKAAWKKYLRTNGLRDRVAEWRRKSQ